MVKLKSYSLNLGYPVYGAQFANDNTVIVAGGGGDGNNGIPNKMTAILIQPDNLKKPVKRYRELTLNENEDSVMSLGVGNGIILAGINENPLMMAKGVNKHLRKFKFENDHLKFLESCQIHPNTNSTIYQKITAISNDGSIGVIVMSDTPSSIYIIETSHDLEEKFKIVTDGDVKDVTISLDGKLMCYITSSVFEVISLVTGRSVYKTNIDFLMSKIRFLDNNEVIISGAKNKDTVIAKFSIASSKIVQQKIVYKNVKGITSMDVNIQNNLTVLATSSYSLLIVRTSDLKVIKVLNKVHDFAITKVVFSKSGKYLASCSAANTVNVIVIPDKFAASKSVLTTIFQYIFSIIIIALLSVGVQYSYENGYVNVAYNKALEIYEHYKPQDSSGYFTVESISSFHPSSATSTEVLVSSSHDASSPSSYFSSSSVTSMSSSSPDLLSSTPSSAFTTTSSSLSTFSSPLSISSSILESSVSGKSILASEVHTSVLDLTSSVVKQAEGEISTLTTTSSLSASVDSEITEVTVPPDEPTPTFDSSDATINGDIISYNEVTTALDPLPTTTSFLDRVDEATEDLLGTATATPTRLSLKSSTGSVIDPITAALKDDNTVTDLFTERAISSTTSSAQIKEITKEIVKEITSIIVSTQTEVSTTVHTSTALVTSIEISVATSVETAVETSIVVETVTREIMITLPKAADVTTVSKALSSLVTESQSFEKRTSSGIADGVGASTITKTSPHSETIETSISSVSTSEASVSLTSKSTEALEIQIEPSKTVYLDPEEAVKSQEEQVRRELVAEAVTTTSSTTIDSSTSETYSIQIEPSSVVFDDPSQALKEEQRLLASEMISARPILEATSIIETVLSSSLAEVVPSHSESITSEEKLLTFTSAPELESVTDFITNIKGDDLSSAEATHVITSSTSILKDEL